MLEAKEVEARIVDRHSASGALESTGERTTAKKRGREKKEGYWQKSPKTTSNSLR